MVRSLVHLLGASNAEVDFTLQFTAGWSLVGSKGLEDHGLVELGDLHGEDAVELTQVDLAEANEVAVVGLAQLGVHLGFQQLAVLLAL
jgi:hypothetical protein